MRKLVKKSYSRKILKDLSKSDERSDQLLKTCELFNEVYAENPFATRKEVTNIVGKKLLNDNIVDSVEMANKLVTTARNLVVPFFASGEKIAQADAQLDHIAKVAKDNLFKPIYTKDGDKVDEVFDPAAAGACTNALKTKMDILLKSQKNVIDAQKETFKDPNKQSDDVVLQDAEREQLERFVASEMMEMPELTGHIEHIIDKIEPDTDDSFKFHEVLSEDE